MKIKFILILLFPILFLITTPSFACKGSQVLFQDNFAKLDQSWGTANDQVSVSNSKLIVKPKVAASYNVINQSEIFQDMDYCADIHLAQGDDTSAGAGLLFWAKDYNDYYFFYFNGGGNYFIGRFVGGRNLYPVPIQKSTAVNTASGAVNHMRVVTKGNQATFYINDTQVSSFTGQPPEGGGLIGVAGDSGAQVPNVWEFSNIDVTKPS